MKYSHFIALAMGLVAGYGCVGTEVGNPQDDGPAEVSVQFTGVEQPPAQALTLSDGVRVDEAWLVFSEASFELADRCDEDIEIDVEEPFAVELIGGAELPAPNRFMRPRADYCRLELELGPLDEARADDFPADLRRDAIVVRGQRADGVDFEVRSALDESIELDGEIRLERGDEALLVAFALDRWFLDTGLDDLPADDAPLRIDAQQHEDVLEAIEGNITESALLIRDDNRDGAAQPSELAAPLADSAADLDDEDPDAS